MRCRKRHFLFILIAVIFFFLISASLERENSTGNLRAGEVVDNIEQNLAIVLLIDVSDSMARTDPDRFREAASRIFIDLLDVEDYLGVIVFDRRAELVVPLQQMKSAANRETIKQEVAARLDLRDYADFRGALEFAYEQLTETDWGNRKPLVFLLTDRIPNPDPAIGGDSTLMEAYMESLWETVADFNLRNIPIYTVGFSEEINPDIISRFSTESRGICYLAAEAVDLPVTFFEAAGGLRDSKVFLQETVELEETAQSFTFEVDDNTRRVNLLAVNVQGEMELSVLPPRGAPEDMRNLAVREQDDYVTVLLSHPEEKQYGTWAIDISGEGQAELRGSLDQYVKASFIEPSPSAQHPLHEPLPLLAEVSVWETLAGKPLEVEVYVTGPESRQPEVVALEKDNDGYFRGNYVSIDRTGEYRLLLRVLLEKELAYTFSSEVYAKRIPVLSTDFWIKNKGFQVGEEMIVTASLNAGGERLREGPTLEVEEFYLLLEYEDGQSVEFPLFDSGKAEHGDARAGDGIWSSRLVFEREGEARAFLRASGVYRDTDFLMEKHLESFNVWLPGTVSIEEKTHRGLWSVAGGSFTMPLEIANRSHLEQTLSISLSGGNARLLQERLLLSPGEKREVSLPVAIAEAAQAGVLNFSLDFTVQDDLTEVAPGRIDFQVEVLSPGAAFWRNIWDYWFEAWWWILVFLALGGGFFLGGISLNRFYVGPRLRVEGILKFRKSDDKSHYGDSFERQLYLEEAKKQEVMITFDFQNLNADFHIKNPFYKHNIIIKNSWNDHMKPFIRGWKALLNRPLMVQTTVECTPPGILEADGVVHTRKNLYHTDVFETGGFVFQYHDVYDRGHHKETFDGKDILEGKF